MSPKLVRALSTQRLFDKKKSKPKNFRAPRKKGAFQLLPNAVITCTDELIGTSDESTCYKPDS